MLWHVIENLPPLNSKHKTFLFLGHVITDSGNRGGDI